MKLGKIAGWALVLCLSARVSWAQEPDQIERFNQQLRQLRESIAQQQRETRENFERLFREQQAQIDALRRQLEAARTNHQPSAPPLAATGQPGAPQTAIATDNPSTPWAPQNPIRLAGGGQSYLNLSFDALVAAGGSTARDVDRLQLGGHDPRQRGFTVQNLETVFDGKVDPYFRGQANLVFQLTPRGETSVEAEEAYFETVALPANLQLRVGQFFTEFGRLNPTHPHTWEFVDQPLVNGRLLGEDGLRSAGARLSWLLPTPFYSELFVTLANSAGPTAFSFRNDHDGAPFLGRAPVARAVAGPGDLLLVPRYVVSVDLSEAQTLVAGVSAALGPNTSGGDTATEVGGVDLFWKWKSPRHHAGFPFVTWQAEGLLRRFEAGAFPGDSAHPALPRETLWDYGLYSQIAYGFRKGWVAAVRGDYVFPGKPGVYELLAGADPERAARWRLSPNLTYYPSEFSKVRLQYNYDEREGRGGDGSVWLQFEFLLGAHAAHKF